MKSTFETVCWKDGKVVLIDQIRLPAEEIYRAYDTVEGVAEAIRSMVVRGAPAIGVTAALGVALAAARSNASAIPDLLADVESACDVLAATRPTAVNLFWAIERMRRLARLSAGLAPAEFRERLLAEAQAIREEDLSACKSIGRFGGDLLPDGARVLTHCNAGGLATAGYGTALGVIRGAVEQGKRVAVLADETRPFLQGARLTTWELQKDSIPVTLISDNMAGHLMARGEIDLCVVGADRIAANGDVANKIGTYSVAVLAREHGLPFYVAAPRSTIDLATPTGKEIPIEERAQDEVTAIAGRRIAPASVPARHPAFDVTPARLVTAIVTERGVARPPYTQSLKALFE
jgi:methylthioribose-1-phosphate isomerase